MEAINPIGEPVMKPIATDKGGVRPQELETWVQNLVKNSKPLDFDPED